MSGGKTGGRRLFLFFFSSPLPRSRQSLKKPNLSFTGGDRVGLCPHLQCSTSAAIPAKRVPMSPGKLEPQSWCLRLAGTLASHLTWLCGRIAAAPISIPCALHSSIFSSAVCGESGLRISLACPAGKAAEAQSKESTDASVVGVQFPCKKGSPLARVRNRDVQDSKIQHLTGLAPSLTFAFPVRLDVC